MAMNGDPKNALLYELMRRNAPAYGPSTGKVVTNVIGDLLPGYGDVIAGQDVMRDFESGNVGVGTALAGLSLLPVLGGAADVARATGHASDAAKAAGKLTVRPSFPVEQVRISPTPAWGPTATHPDHGMLGAVKPREEMPEVLYHVTNNAEGIAQSGALRATPGGGGLGGRSLPASISFTASREAAQNIEDATVRVGQIARGEVDAFEPWLRKLASADAGGLGVSPARLDRAVDAGLATLKGRGDPDSHFAAYTAYLQRRGEMASTLAEPGDALRLRYEDPLIFAPKGQSVAEAFGHVSGDNISVIRINPRQLPDDVVVAHQPSLHADEWRVWSQEIPVSAVRTPGPGPSAFRPAMGELVSARLPDGRVRLVRKDLLPAGAVREAKRARPRPEKVRAHDLLDDDRWEALQAAEAEMAGDVYRLADEVDEVEELAKAARKAGRTEDDVEAMVARVLEDEPDLDAEEVQDVVEDLFRPRVEEGGSVPGEAEEQAVSEYLGHFTGDEADEVVTAAERLEFAPPGSVLPRMSSAEIAGKTLSEAAPELMRQRRIMAAVAEKLKVEAEIVTRKGSARGSKPRKVSKGAPGARGLFSTEAGEGPLYGTGTGRPGVASELEEAMQVPFRGGGAHKALLEGGEGVAVRAFFKDMDSQERLRAVREIFGPNVDRAPAAPRASRKVGVRARREADVGLAKRRNAHAEKMAEVGIVASRKQREARLALVEDYPDLLRAYERAADPERLLAKAASNKNPLPQSGIDVEYLAKPATGLGPWRTLVNRKGKDEARRIARELIDVDPALKSRPDPLSVKYEAALIRELALERAAEIAWARRQRRGSAGRLKKEAARRAKLGYRATEQHELRGGVDDDGLYLTDFPGQRERQVWDVESQSYRPVQLSDVKGRPEGVDMPGGQILRPMGDGRGGFIGAPYSEVGTRRRMHTGLQHQKGKDPDDIFYATGRGGATGSSGHHGGAEVDRDLITSDSAHPASFARHQGDMIPTSGTGGKDAFSRFGEGRLSMHARAKAAEREYIQNKIGTQRAEQLRQFADRLKVGGGGKGAGSSDMSYHNLLHELTLEYTGSMPTDEIDMIRNRRRAAKAFLDDVVPRSKKGGGYRFREERVGPALDRYEAALSAEGIHSPIRMTEGGTMAGSKIPLENDAAVIERLDKQREVNEAADKIRLARIKESLPVLTPGEYKRMQALSARKNLTDSEALELGILKAVKDASKRDIKTLRDMLQKGEVVKLRPGQEKLAEDMARYRAGVRPTGGVLGQI